jgi:hypothetical protein
MHATAAGGESNLAAARVEAMASLLANEQRLGVSVDCAYDAVQSSGEKIEFGERRDYKLRRPNRARVDVTGRDGFRRGVVFNGTQLTTFDRSDKVYATVERPGTVDAALAYYTQRLKMRLPLRELFAADLPQKLKDVLPSVRLIGSETIDGKATDHVAFRHDDADVQLWIAQDGRPLPQRIVISYRREPGHPQFRGDFHGWTFSPDVPDSSFTYAPPADFEKILILAPGRRDESDRKPQ